MSVHPQYIPRNPWEPQSVASSIEVLRTSDNALFLASQIPKTLTEDLKGDTATTNLASAILPAAAVSLSRILNHPNIVSLVDIVQNPTTSASTTFLSGPHGDLTIWEDMTAGSLAYLLPASNSLPQFADKEAWHTLSSQNYLRFSLPESLCWHVLRSISRALLWLHHGVKETEGIRGQWMAHDDDWHPVLIMDVSPAQIWFKRPKGEETYGECKLAGFQWAKVTGSVGGRVAFAQRVEGASRVKQYYWAPEVYKNTHSWSRPSEIWSLGAVIYAMMTGTPPARPFEYHWQISRMNDKGFSQGLREIVQGMLEPDPGARPQAVDLVNRVDHGWRTWRVQTEEGRALVDVEDREVARALNGGRGMGLLG